MGAGWMGLDDDERVVVFEDCTTFGLSLPNLLLSSPFINVLVTMTGDQQLPPLLIGPYFFADDCHGYASTA